MSTLYKQFYDISKFDKRQQKPSIFNGFVALFIFMCSENRIIPSDLSFIKRQKLYKKLPCMKITHGNGFYSLDLTPK